MHWRDAPIVAKCHQLEATSGKIMLISAFDNAHEARVYFYHYLGNMCHSKVLRSFKKWANFLTLLPSKNRILQFCRNRINEMGSLMNARRIPDWKIRNLIGPVGCLSGS